MDNEVLLYDVTSTYFEGQAEANSQAQRGYSREHRPDCRLVCSAPALATPRAPCFDEIARIQSHDVILPTATHGEIRLRWVTQPDTAQAALLGRLGIVLPRRMRLSELGLPATTLSA